MIEIEVKVDTSRFDRAMADLPAAMARARRVALNKIGNTVKNHAINAFKDSSLRPSPWAPRKSGGKHPLLIRSGNMRQGITYVLRGDSSVVVGTPAKYAAYHQFGTKRMPARPFFPFDENGNLMPTVLQKITRKVQDAYSAELRKLVGH